MLLALLVPTGPAAGQPGAASQEETLYRDLHSTDAQARRSAEEGLWRLWVRSGDEAADRALEHGTLLMHTGRLSAAIAVFSDLLRRHPGFTEAWNKRATAYFLAGEDRKSVADCEEVLKRNPRHFGALSGMGLLMQRLGEPEAALDWFRRALAVNPGMEGIRHEMQQLEKRLRPRGQPA